MDGKNCKTYTMYMFYKAIAKCVIPRRESFFCSLLGRCLYHRHFKLPFITFLFSAGCCPSVVYVTSHLRSLFFPSFQKPRVLLDSLLPSYLNLHQSLFHNYFHFLFLSSTVTTIIWALSSLSILSILTSRSLPDFQLEPRVHKV